MSQNTKMETSTEKPLPVILNLRNKFEQLSIMINGNIDIFMKSETKLDETFPAAQFYLQGFCNPC